ncbi:MAG: hypothetical protein ACK4ZJ_17145, partial [Allorhizobium sp.]
MADVVARLQRACDRVEPRDEEYVFHTTKLVLVRPCVLARACPRGSFAAQTLFARSAHVRMLTMEQRHNWRVWLQVRCAHCGRAARRSRRVLRSDTRTRGAIVTGCRAAAVATAAC